jgi:hypothetical protein
MSEQTPEQSWMARVWTCRYKKWMLWEEEQRQGSVLKLLWTVRIPATLIMRIWVGVPSGVLRTHSADRHRAPSGVSMYRIAVRQTSISERWMDNTARAEFWVESECGCEWKSERCWRRKIQSHMSVTGRGVRDVRIHLEVDKHAGEPWSLPSLSLYTGEGSV